MIEQILQSKTSYPNNINKNNKYYTALYSRLSQDDNQNGDSNSIVNQKKLLESYAIEHGYNNFIHFIDDGYSGTNFNRPNFSKMIKEIESGYIDRIIIKDMSRLGRDYLQVGMYTEIIFPKYDIHFIAINDSVDSNKPQENDLTPFKNLFNEWYAKDTSKKIRAIMKSKGMSGEYLSSIAPYGYYKNPENPKEWLVDEYSSKIVKEIFHLCIKGFGPLKISNILKERKILCPSAYATSKGYPVITKTPTNPYQWSSTIVADILERREYLGHTVNFKTYRKSYKERKKLYNDKENLKVFKNTHEAIVDETTFDIVQKIRQGKRRQTRTGYISMFSGILFCADCGSKLSLLHLPNNMNKDAYFCSKYRHNTKACSMHYIRHKVLEEIILLNLREMLSYVKDYEADFVKMIIESDVKEKNKDLKKKKCRISEIEKRYVYIDELFQRIYEDNINNKLSDERFIKLSKAYEEEQKQIEEEKEVLIKELEIAEDQTVNVSSFLNIVHKYTYIEKLTPEILHEFIDHIIIHEADKSSGKRTQEIEIIYNYIGKYK